jgi:hypothetical protein
MSDPGLDAIQQFVARRIIRPAQRNAEGQLIRRTMTLEYQSSQTE